MGTDPERNKKEKEENKDPEPTDERSMLLEYLCGELEARAKCLEGIDELPPEEQADLRAMVDEWFPKPLTVPDLGKPDN